MIRDEEIEKNPMDGAQAPIVPDRALPVLDVDQLRALLATPKAQ